MGSNPDEGLGVAGSAEAFQASLGFSVITPFILLRNPPLKYKEFPGRKNSSFEQKVQKLTDLKAC